MRTLFALRVTIERLLAWLALQLIPIIHFDLGIYAGYHAATLLADGETLIGPILGALAMWLVLRGALEMLDSE